MKRFALAAALLAAIGLNVGCGGQTTDTTPPAEPTPEVEPPPVDDTTTGDDATGTDPTTAE